MDHKAAASAEVRFFVTGPHVFPMTTMDGEAAAAGGVQHAKALGTTVTACGLRTGSWPKLWDVAFNPDEPAACRACAVAAERLRAAVAEAAQTAAKSRRRGAAGKAAAKARNTR